MGADSNSQPVLDPMALPSSRPININTGASQTNFYNSNNASRVYEGKPLEAPYAEPQAQGNPPHDPIQQPVFNGQSFNHVRKNTLVGPIPKKTQLKAN